MPSVVGVQVIVPSLAVLFALGEREPDLVDREVVFVFGWEREHLQRLLGFVVPGYSRLFAAVVGLGQEVTKETKGSVAGVI